MAEEKRYAIAVEAGDMWVLLKTYSTIEELRQNYVRDSDKILRKSGINPLPVEILDKKRCTLLENLIS